MQLTVTGVKGVLYDNVMARLNLNLHKDNQRLSHYDIRRLHQQAEKDIRTALAPYGYYNPRIKGALVRVESGFEARYDIAIGKPVLVTALDISLVGKGQKSELLNDMADNFPLQTGHVLHQGEYEEGKKKLILAALREGFLNARFTTHQIRINKSKNQGEIELVLDTGPQFVFGKTRFIGSSLRSKLLMKYLPYKPGDAYSQSILFNAQKILYKTNYFDSVIVEGLSEEADGLEIPVIVRLTEPARKNRYSIGLGYATDTGARARLEWNNKLLNSRGHKISGSGQVSELDNSIGLDYEIPGFNPRSDTLNLNTSFHDQVWRDTETRLFTAGATYEHRDNVFTQGYSLEFREEDYRVGLTSGRSKLVMPTITGTAIWADNLLNTDYGMEVSLSLSGAAENFGSDVSFLKGVASGKLIVTLWPGLRVIGRGSLGATLVDSIDDLPPSLRFYTGGDQSIRGYSYKELGTQDSSGAVVGGRYLVVGSAEVEKEVTEKWSMAAFWDVGNAVDDLSVDFKQSVGVGVRYRLPFGQVRLDVASAILEDGLPMRLHLTVGADL